MEVAQLLNPVPTPMTTLSSNTSSRASSPGAQFSSSPQPSWKPTACDPEDDEQSNFEPEVPSFETQLESSLNMAAGSVQRDDDTDLASDAEVDQLDSDADIDALFRSSRKEADASLAEPPTQPSVQNTVHEPEPFYEEEFQPTNSLWSDSPVPAPLEPIATAAPSQATQAEAAVQPPSSPPAAPINIAAPPPSATATTTTAPRRSKRDRSKAAHELAKLAEGRRRNNSTVSTSSSRPTKRRRVEKDVEAGDLCSASVGTATTTTTTATTTTTTTTTKVGIVSPSLAAPGTSSVKDVLIPSAAATSSKLTLRLKPSRACSSAGTQVKKQRSATQAQRSGDGVGTTSEEDVFWTSNPSGSKKRKLSEVTNGLDVLANAACAAKKA